MSDLAIRISFTMLCMADWAIIGYCMWNAARHSDRLLAEQDLKRYWKEFAASTDTLAWPFYDGEGIY